MLMMSQSVQANSLTVDQIIYQNGSGVNATLFSGSVDATITGTGSSTMLTILLQNTSADGAATDAGSPSLMLLTGIGFQLAGVTITGGSVSVNTGSTALNFDSGQSTTDIGNQWGYANSNPDGFGDTGVLALNHVVSTMASSGSTRFEGAPPSSIDGPAYGAVSANETQFGNSLAGVDDTIKIVLDLSGTVNIGNINNVVLSFGSPDSVPDGGCTIALLGSALLGIGAFGRKLRAR